MQQQRRGHFVAERERERELRRRQREMYGGQLPRHQHGRRGHGHLHYGHFVAERERERHYGDPAAGRYEGPFADEVNVRFEQAEMDFRDRFLLARDRSISAAAAASAPPPPPPPPNHGHRLSR